MSAVVIFRGVRGKNNQFFQPNPNNVTLSHNRYIDCKDSELLYLFLFCLVKFCFCILFLLSHFMVKYSCVINIITLTPNLA